jgi:hypothetical protein
VREKFGHRYLFTVFAAESPYNKREDHLHKLSRRIVDENLACAKVDVQGSLVWSNSSESKSLVSVIAVVQPLWLAVRRLAEGLQRVVLLELLGEQPA